MQELNWKKQTPAREAWNNSFIFRMYCNIFQALSRDTLITIENLHNIITTFFQQYVETCSLQETFFYAHSVLHITKRQLTKEFIHQSQRCHFFKIFFSFWFTSFLTNVSDVTLPKYSHAQHDKWNSYPLYISLIKPANLLYNQQ